MCPLGNENRSGGNNVAQACAEIAKGRETGIARDILFRAGDVRWDPRVGLHTSENTGGPAIRIIEKLSKLSSRFKIAMENAQVRILRATLRPREIAFTTPVVAVRLSDGESHWRPAAGTPVSNELDEASEWIFVELK